MNHSPQRIGFLQAMCLSAYIGLFALCAVRIEGWAHNHNIAPHPIAGIILFLFAFVTSALICTSIVFAYPITLFFSDRRSHALRIVLWNAVWLIAIFILATLMTLLVR